MKGNIVKNKRTIGAKGVKGEDGLSSLNVNGLEPLLLLENNIMEFKYRAYVLKVMIQKSSTTKNLVGQIKSYVSNLHAPKLLEGHK
jgi:hypothetical protein